MKTSFAEVTAQLDRFFFLPLSENETPDSRALAIEAYLESVGWTWNEVIAEMSKSSEN